MLHKVATSGDTVLSVNRVTKPVNHHLLNASSRYNRVYKRFLTVNGHFRAKYQTNHIDLFSGGDFRDIVKPYVNEAVLMRLIHENMGAIHRYPQTELNSTLSQSFASFLELRYGVIVNPSEEILICPGVNQALDAISRTFCGRFIYVPEYSVPFSKTIPVANGAHLLTYPMGKNTRLDLVALQRLFKANRSSDVRFLYLNYPNNPTGGNLTLEELNSVISEARRNNILVVNDHDICFTSYDNERPITSIFQTTQGINAGLELYTFSKEFCLAGIRVGIIVGPKDLVTQIRLHNWHYGVMVPTLHQAIAAMAVNSIESERISQNFHESMKVLVEGFMSLGWRCLISPDAGIAFRLPVPESFTLQNAVPPSELFSFFLQSQLGVGLAPGTMFGENGEEWVRVEIMQPASVLVRMFERLASNGVRINMEVENSVISAMQAFEYKYHDVV